MLGSSEPLVGLCETIYWTILINKFTAEIILLTVLMCYLKHLVKGGDSRLFPDSVLVAGVLYLRQHFAHLPYYLMVIVIVMRKGKSLNSKSKACY